MKKRTIGITAAAVAGTAVLAGGAAIAFAAGSAPTPATSLASTPGPASGSTSPSPSPSPSASFDDDRVAAADIDRAIQAALDAAGPGAVIEADIDDDATHAYEIDILLDAGGVAEVKLDAAFQVVSVTPDDRDGDDGLATDAARLHAASAAALAHVGSGQVVGVEVSDDADHLYEVEIQLADGEDIDVELDASFTVVRTH